MQQFNTVPVSSQELEELKRQAEELNQRIKELSKPRQIAPYVSVKPLDVPRNLYNNKPIFGFTERCDPDVWNAFIRLAKSIHTESPEFYMDTAYGNGIRKPYIRSTLKNAPRSIHQLSQQQVRISAEMLDDMIAVYNKYMAMLHTQVVYDPKDGSGARLVDVIPPDFKEDKLCGN